MNEKKDPAGRAGTSVEIDPDVEADVAELIDAHRQGATNTEVRGRQYDLGLAWVWFPQGCGGRGLAPAVQDYIDDRLAAAGVPGMELTSGIGIAMSAPTLAAFGSEVQRQRHLRRIFTGEDIWCQLFSEPGSGSDLAGLATRAELVGDEWVLNGQKVWTSFATLSDWALVLARHDPELPKHRGLTYFIVNMRSPGLEVRPLREMTGEDQFSEVFLQDVRIPDTQRVGDVGQGWAASLSTLANERAGRGDALGADALGVALDIWSQQAEHDPIQRDRLVRLWIASTATRWLAERAMMLRTAGVAGPESSVAKLASAELGQEIHSFCLDLLGADGMVMPGGFEPASVERSHGFDGRSAQWRFLRSRGYTIEGGTAQIQRNVLAERILGLPSEGREDRTMPWKLIPRSG